jgi:hypothetical protein
VREDVGGEMRDEGCESWFHVRTKKLRCSLRSRGIFLNAKSAQKTQRAAYCFLGWCVYFMMWQLAVVPNGKNQTERVSTGIFKIWVADIFKDDLKII